MLNKKMVGATKILVDNLASKGLALCPVPGAPLMDLVQCTLPVFKNKYGNQDVVDSADIADGIVACSNAYNSKIQTCSDHDAMHDRVVTGVVDVIQANLAITRNKVQPLVVEMVERVEKELQSFSNVAFATPIITDSVLGIFDNPFVENLIKDSIHSNYYDDLRSFSNFPSLDVIGIRALIPPYGSTLDKQIDELFEKIGSLRLIEVYAMAFVNRELSLRTVSRNEYLMLLLLINSIKEHKPAEFARLLDEEDHGWDNLRDMQEQLAIRINNSLTQWRESYQSNTMVISYPKNVTPTTSNPEPIVVHEELYNEWLDAGGDSDILYGSMLRARYHNAKDLMDNAIELRYQARQALNEIASANETMRVNVIRRTYRQHMHEYIMASRVEGGDNYGDEFVDRLNQHLNNATAIDLDDVFGYATLLVCDVLFPDTYARKIIDGMNHYQRLNPEERPEDLATLVIHDLLVEWVVNLCMVKPLGA